MWWWKDREQRREERRRQEIDRIARAALCYINDANTDAVESYLQQVKFSHGARFLTEVMTRIAELIDSKE